MSALDSNPIMEFIETPLKSDMTGKIIVPPKLGSVPPTTFGPGLSSAVTPVVTAAPVGNLITSSNIRVTATVEDTGRPPGASLPTSSLPVAPIVPAPQTSLKSVATNAQEAAIEKEIFGNVSSRPAAQVQQGVPPAPLQMVQSYAPATPFVASPVQCVPLASLFQPAVSQAPSFTPPQAFAPQVWTEDDGQDDNFESEPDEADFYEEHEEPATVTTPVAAAVPVVVEATPAAPLAAPQCYQAPTLPEAVKGLFDGMNNEAQLGDSAGALRQIEMDTQGLWYHLGKSVLDSPVNYHPEAQNKLHDILYTMRWDPDQLMRIGPHALCSYETLLTAHQVWVQGLENEWVSRYRILGNELNRLCFKKRDGYPGSTVAAKELAVFADQGSMATLRVEYLRAWAMHSLLEGMGERFAQLEDGLKRTISLISEEYRRTQNR